MIRALRRHARAGEAAPRLLMAVGADIVFEVVLHDLRHATTTILLAAGVPLPVVSAVMGHASVAFTVKLYGHLQPEHLRVAADAIAQAYG